MAHRRAVSRGPAWGLWLLVPVALALDVTAALTLEGRPFPMGVAVPEAVLLAAPLLVYGILVHLVLRARPLGTRLAAEAVLLGMHAGLVTFHAFLYMGLWSLPAAAAFRLAHRWSPLIPLLQLVWVPLLALPLATLRTWRLPARSSPSAAVPGRRSPPASRAPHPARLPAELAREVRAEPGAPGLAPAAATERASRVPSEPAASPSVPAVPVPMAAETTTLEVSAEPAPVSASRGEPPASVPAPTWFDELPEVLPPAVPAALPSAEAVAAAAAVEAAPAPISIATEAIAVIDDEAAIPVAVEPAAAGHDEVPMPVTIGPVAALPPATVDTLEHELPLLAGSPGLVEDEPPVAEVARPALPAAAAAPRAVAPPIDLDLVARVFAPYGPLLSRDGAVVVDWTPGPDVAVVCVAPRAMSRDHAARLAARLAWALDAREVPSALGPISRLSLQDSDGVVVLTPLHGAVLVAAARRRGALALLEVLSRRVARPEVGDELGNGEPGAPVPASAIGPALVDLRPGLDGGPPGGGDSAVAHAVRVATPRAWVDVVAPSGIEVEAAGALAGRLVAALADGEAAGAAGLRALSVDLPAHRLVIHPIHPHARPPRFVAVVGGPERPGLLGRRAERAARMLREAS